MNFIYLVFNNLEAYIEEHSKNKYFILAPTNNNRDLIEKYTEIWNEIKKHIQLINNETIGYNRDFYEN